MESCPCNDGAASATFGAALQFFAASQCLIQEPWPAQATLRNESSFDFVIVGGGTAGSTLAARLSEVPYFKVLLLEAGGNPPIESIIPGFQGALLFNPDYHWNFTIVDDHYSSQAVDGGKQTLPRGKMLGGSGSHNDMVYARGYPADYNEWASIVGNQWNWENVLKYFKKTERVTDERILKNPELLKYHGLNGEIEVTGLKELGYETERYLEGFRELGFKILGDLTYPYVIGAAHLSVTVKDGYRHSATTALLNQAAKRDNLFVLKDVLVTKILIENQTAYGVRVLYNNDELIFFANKEVIMSSGTFNTAKLLLLSGVGPKDHLKNIGIKVVQDLPVGENLHDHTLIFSFLAAENGTCYSDQATDNFNIIKYLYNRTGPLSVSPATKMGLYFSLNSSSTPNVPDFATFPQCVPVQSSTFDIEQCMKQFHFNHNICSKLKFVNKNKEIIFFYTVQLKPKSRGKVKLRSSNALDKPLIFPGTFSDPDDLEGYPEAIGVIRSLAKTAYFKSKRAYFIEIDVEQCVGLDGSEAEKCKARAMGVIGAHEVGTTAMGAVLNSKLKVYGVTGLRVVCASVMPKITRGNTNSPTVMIAEQAADFIKEEYRKEIDPTCLD